MDRRGLWQEADRGTVFLDEVTETSLAFQVKLLRALQEGEFRRVGSNQMQRVDVRVIAATNRDAEQEVGEGRFRQGFPSLSAECKTRYLRISHDLHVDNQ